MAARDGEQPGGDSTNGQWEGYSDFQTVSSNISRSIDEALSAYTELESMHAENAKVQDMQAARARSRLKLAALKLVPELKTDAPNVESYQQMLGRWLGAEEIDFDINAPEDGYFDRLNQIRLVNECPDWIGDWALDIRTAGWELGYLKAGRQTEDDADDPVEASAREMVEDILEAK